MFLCFWPVKIRLFQWTLSVNKILHFLEKLVTIQQSPIQKKKVVFTRASKKVSTTQWGGGVTPILTNAFLEQIKNNMQNLSNTKVFKVTKGCLKNLARAKNKMRAQKNKSRFLEQLILPPPPIFRNCVPAPNHAFRGAQNSLNRDLFQYLTLKHDLHISGTLRAGLAEFRPQKFLDYLSNNLYNT